MLWLSVPEPSPAVSTANERNESLIPNHIKFEPVFELLDMPTGISPIPNQKIKPSF